MTIQEQAEQVERAYQLLKDRWADQGRCASCGWHAQLEEHCFDNVDVSTALFCEGFNKVLHLNCASDDEDAHLHRGVRVNLNEL
jgi:hypothetical protein